MKFSRTQSSKSGVLALCVSLLAVPALSAQTRVVLPEGSVIVVRTSSPLESATARVGQTFETVVTDTVRVDNYTVVPAAASVGSSPLPRPRVASGRAWLRSISTGSRCPMGRRGP